MIKRYCFGRMKVEYAALKESLESMGHLTTSIRRLRLALLKVFSTLNFRFLKFIGVPSYCIGKGDE